MAADTMLVAEVCKAVGWDDCPDVSRGDVLMSL